MPFDAKALANITVIDSDEKPHRLGDLWKDEPHALLFLRHFG